MVWRRHLCRPSVNFKSEHKQRLADFSKAVAWDRAAGSFTEVSAQDITFSDESVISAMALQARR